ncbi:hypothetical protein LAZ67_11002046 [Cordylochernes scorpioides]|uniref:Uncharacterized protein n=1 Tax=Cordylochernes scorpioides TaxID=51811 RepID=A0ABY6KYX6_9ARAC|nr:hypothetical protein LAZ67_11002046 [Cordylochernes scorpioides]
MKEIDPGESAGIREKRTDSLTGLYNSIDRKCGNPITHPLPRLPSTFRIGFTTEPVKVDRMTEDSNMQRITEAGDEYFADALTNMQPHCEDLISRLTDAIRGIAVPRVEEALTSLFDGSYAASNFIQQLERTSEGPQDDATLQTRLRTLLKDLNNHLNPYPNIIESRKLAIQRTNDRHDKEKLKYDNKHKNPHFDTGDLVLVKAYHHPNSEGREDVNDEERAGRPNTSTTDEKINEVEKMILANRRITVKEVAEDLNISIGSCHSIFINDLGMRRVAAKFLPKLLKCDQKQHRMNIANEMLDSVRDYPNLLQRVITGDESWVYGYDVETKAQSSQWKLPHEPRPKKARQVRSNVKVLLTVFFDCRGVVHHEFLPQGRTVNKEY